MTTPRRRAGSRSTPRHQAWPGSEAPLGATWDGEGTNFAVYSASAEGVDVVLYDDDGAETATYRTRGAHRPCLAWICRPGRSRSAIRASRPWAVRPAPRAPPQPAQVAARPIRAGDRRKVQARSRTLRLLVRRRRSRSESARFEQPSMPRSVVVDRSFPWGEDRRPDTAWADTVIYELHVKGFTEAQSRRSGGVARNVCGPRASELARLPAAARRHRRRAHARPPLHRRGPPRRSRPRELLGLQLGRVFLAREPLLRRRRQWRPGPRIQGHGSGTARRRARGDPRRRLQPHRRGQPPRTDGEFSRYRQPFLLPARRGRAALLLRCHRAPATASTSAARSRCS